jgi:hypothetical protein
MSFGRPDVANSPNVSMLQSNMISQRFKARVANWCKENGAGTRHVLVYGELSPTTG